MTTSSKCQNHKGTTTMDRSAPVAPTDQDVSTADKSSRKRPRTPGGIIQNAGIQGQVPPYVPKVKSCIECRQQKVLYFFLFCYRSCLDRHFYRPKLKESSVHQTTSVVESFPNHNVFTHSRLLYNPFCT